MSCNTGSVILPLYQERKRRGWTQEYLANLSRLKQSHISAYETGKICPPLSAVIRMSNALGFDLKLELYKRPTPLPPDSNNGGGRGRSESA